MAVTTNISPNNAYRERLVACSTAGGLLTSNVPGFRKVAAADTVIRFPIEKPGNHMAIMYFTPNASSAGYYAQIDIAYANNTTDPAWAGKKTTFGSGIPTTVESAWARYVSTTIVEEIASSMAGAFMLGPIDTARYACNFGGTSSNITDKYEGFINVMVGLSSEAAGTAASHDALSASAQTCYVGAFTIPE
ncbi:MAG: hypothetical protein V1736_01655 [Pseudomonadota bacterium]